MAMQGRK